MSNVIIDKDGGVWQRRERPGLDTAYLKVESQKGVPTYRWNGRKIPVGLMQTCLAFFRDVNSRWKSEAVLHLFYSDADGWMAWPFPQEITHGLSARTVGDITQDPAFKMFKGMDIFGTIHSHCDAPAFQSGTDKQDEAGIPGIHITLGNVNAKLASIHTRVLYACDMQKWFFENLPMEDLFYLPDEMEAKAKSLEDDGFSVDRDSALRKMVLKEPDKTVQYPKEWMENMRPKVYQQSLVQFKGGQQGLAQGSQWHGWGDDGWPDGSFHQGGSRKFGSLREFKNSLMVNLSMMQLEPSDVAEVWDVVEAVVDAVLETEMTKTQMDAIKKTITDAFEDQCAREVKEEMQEQLES